MNKIYFGDNLPILKNLDSESVDLIYIDPPFNTGKVQKRTTIKTVQSEYGERKGFQGKSYETQELGTNSYSDSFDNFIDDFLRLRIIEAYRILKPHGSLYFHIDYREVHYCKVFLDEIFGRECFMNEIIWAYDYGGRARSKWPAKHDNILFYVKDPKNYIFTTANLDREDYMAPGLVRPEKAKLGKLPTDTWFAGYVGGKQNPDGGQLLTDTWKFSGQDINDNWWMTIVPTNSKERIGYPTQKPRKLIDRIVNASSLPGSTVLDFFAGSGTVGSSCIDLERNFILVDSNLGSMEVMAKRFSGIEDIQWFGFDPSPYIENHSSKTANKLAHAEKRKNYSPDFESLVAIGSYLQKELKNKSDMWEGSPFEWVLQFSARQKSTFGRQLVDAWCQSKGLITEKPKESSESLIINGKKFSIKFSTLWTNGIYKFQQIRQDGYDYVLCFGISPREAHCWILEREFILEHVAPQHKGAQEYWFVIKPQTPPDWLRGLGGSLDEALQIIQTLKPK